MLKYKSYSPFLQALDITIEAILKYSYDWLYNDHCVPCMKVKQCLKDSPRSTEWIDIHYMCIRESVKVI